MVAALLVTLGVPLLNRDGGAKANDACTATSTVVLVVAPDLGEAVEDVLAEPVAYDGGCARAVLSRVEPVIAVASLATVQPDQLPHLWIPDSSLWAARAGETPVKVVGSVASSPLVLGTSRQAVEELGWVAQPPTWGDALTSGRDLAVPDLDSSASGILSLAAVSASLGGGETGRNAVVQAALAAARGQVPTVSRALITAAEGGASAALVPMPEQQVLATNRARQESRLVAVYPAEGSPALDYPVLRVRGSADPDDADPGDAAVQAVIDRLLSSEARQVARRAGFRDPAGSAPDGADASGAQEPAPAALTIPPEDVAALLARLSALAVPSRILTVFDVSTSMRASAGDGLTRADLARDAAKGALAALPDTARVGLWYFASRMNGDVDHVELSRTRPLAQNVGGRSQREALSAELDSLPDSLKSGGTSLYDTTLAAVRATRESYEPDAVNTVVVITDGRNEDSAGVQLDELLSTLRDEQDPERPVQLVLVGLGPDADDAALSRIAEASGGRSYEAADPRDLQAVLFDVLSQRSD
jgi:hypothetical protein